MKYLDVIDDSKDFLKKMAYNIIYGSKWKKLLLLCYVCYGMMVDE